MQAYYKSPDTVNDIANAMSFKKYKALRAAAYNIKFYSSTVSKPNFVLNRSPSIVISNLPKESVKIKADGRHLWRVLENLYNNIFKYAVRDSRVYIDILADEKTATFIIKNISENPLNMRPEELTERFVRGDVSRTTEGSGLGLSIAKSLTILQGGKFDIIIDGDLFKVQIKFEKVA